jgi:cell division protein FtsX
VPRLEYYFRETASGLRRNGIVAFAAMSTAFIALFLFGLALLIGRQLSLVIDAYTRNVEVAIYLTDPVKEDVRATLEETSIGTSRRSSRTPIPTRSPRPCA